MKLGLLIYGDLKMVSGGFLYDRLLVDYLRRRGDEVEVIPLKWGNYASCLFDNLSRRLLANLAGSRYGLLLQDELIHPSFFGLNYRLRSVVRYPLVSIVHHLRCFERRPFWQNTGYRGVEYLYLNSVDGFIFNSFTTREAVRSLVAGRVPHVVAFPAGDHIESRITETEISERAVQPGRPLEILFLGSVTPRKQLHLLIDALALVKGDWSLTVIGSLSADARYARVMQKKIQGSDLRARVRLLGTLGEEELAAVMRRSHLLAVPSSYEGFGIVYLEAMSLGLPALASTAGGAKEIITDGHDGFLIPPYDKWALALRIQKLADNRAALASMAINARRSYAARPRWNEGLGKIYDFIHRLRRSAGSFGDHGEES